MIKHLPIIGITIFTVMSSGNPATAITFSDSTFNNQDWQLTTFLEGDGGSITASQVMTGGNSGSFRQIAHTINTANGNYRSSVWGFHIKLDAVYNPQILGAIASIDYSEDAKFLSGTSIGAGQATGLALVQDGKFYSIWNSGSFTTPETNWTNKSRLSLTQNDFRLYGNPSQTPDFSATGSEIKWGFFRANSTSIGGGRYSRTAGIDNWVVRINQANPSTVPEPSAILGLLTFLGFGITARLKSQQQ